MVANLLEDKSPAPSQSRIGNGVATSALSPGSHFPVSHPRRLRLIELGNAIRAGEYQVSAGNLADALLRYARRAN